MESFRKQRRDINLETLSPHKYGNYLGTKNIDEIRKIIHKHGFELSDDEIVDLCGDVLHDLWRSIAKVIDSQMEIKWTNPSNKSYLFTIFKSDK